MDRKALFGLALFATLAGCAEYGGSASDLRGGRFDPCATVRCAAGTHCVSHGRQAECVADPTYADDAGTGSACDTVRCAAPLACVETPEGPTCQCTSIGFCVEGWTWDDTTCECVENPTSSCAAVLCIVGTVCEETPSGPRCVPVPSECQTDSDCHLEDNYCGGCNCLALAEGESGPRCSDPVQCFAAPCQVTSGVAACVDGQCVLQDGTTF